MKRMTALLAAVMLMIGMATEASALTLTLTSGADTVVIQDNTPPSPPNGGIDLNAALNNILYSGSVNGIDVYFAHGSSTFNPSQGAFDIGSFIFNGKGTISILLSESGLTLSSLASTSPNLLVSQSLSDSNLSLPPNAPIITSDVKINGQSVPGIEASLVGAGAVNTTGLATVGGLFNLEELITINLGSTGNTISLDSTVTVAPVPEPGTMILLGAGLLGLAIYGKRRQNC